MLALASHLIVLDRGKVVAQGPAEQIIQAQQAQRAAA
jgi:ABC-type molybdate transport system ATPase subunit